MQNGRPVQYAACKKDVSIDPKFVKLRANVAGTIIIIKIKIHSSCEIEDFVETHLCKLCVILRSRALRVVCPH